MEWIHNIFKSVDPLQFVLGAIALCGGVARYLNGFINGTPFSFRVFLASAFVAGFTGWIFATVGTSMAMPQGVVFAMAGTGGFFGEQTMKLTMEWMQARVK